ncbi:MAG: hypothetical protein M5U34_01820 [Chloroflexi bacterium]|nr:hypothetical protein [Chloroflexota bacterium]
MNQTATIQQLTNRLRRIEAEIVAVREELKTLPRQQDHPLPFDATVSDTWVNKAALREQIRRLFLTLSIQGEPVGVEALQKRMREAELASNELSQSIIAAREE